MPMPFVGEMVKYQAGADQGEGLAPKGQPYAAIVTHVWSETTVNLLVIGDGSYLLPSPPGSTLTSELGSFVTSVLFNADPVGNPVPRTWFR